MFARFIIMIAALACASAAALVFLPLAVIFDPLVQHATSHVPADHWFDILTNILTEEDPDEAISTLFHLVWTIGMLICVLPVTIAALVGRLTRSSSFFFYAGLAGFLAAAMPWVLRTGKFSERTASFSPAELHLTAILFLTGVVAGTVYWLIAGRDRHDTPSGGWMSSYSKG